MTDEEVKNLKFDFSWITLTHTHKAVTRRVEAKKLLFLVEGNQAIENGYFHEYHWILRDRPFPNLSYPRGILHDFIFQVSNSS